jgi:hypothetical protein
MCIIRQIPVYKRIVWLDKNQPKRNVYDTHCKTNEEAIELIKQNRVMCIDVDDEGLPVVELVCEKFLVGEIEWIDFFIHTINLKLYRKVSELRHKASGHMFEQPNFFDEK